MPGVTGRSQRHSFTPGAPWLSSSASMPFTISRMAMDAECQPDAVRVPNGPRFAASASRWKYCGSNLPAKRSTASSVTSCGPATKLSPTTMSSQYRMFPPGSLSLQRGPVTVA